MYTRQVSNRLVCLPPSSDTVLSVFTHTHYCQLRQKVPHPLQAITCTGHGVCKSSIHLWWTATGCAEKLTRHRSEQASNHWDSAPRSSALPTTVGNYIVSHLVHLHKLMHFIFTHFCELKNDPSTTFPYKSTEIHEAISSNNLIAIILKISQILTSP